jgi:alpha-L-fucosidase 2
MLVQSHDEETDSVTGRLVPVIHLLPALPPAWKDGAARGLRARGGFELDFIWRDGTLATLNITSTVGGVLFLRCGARLTRLDTRPGQVLQFPDGKVPGSPDPMPVACVPARC